MRTLSASLLTAQKQSSRVPAVSLKASNLRCGVVNLKWERLYTGAEPDGPHALTIPADGSLIRLRATPSADSRKLYRQRVTAPGPVSDFSQWAYLDQYNVMAAAACSLGAEVNLFWLKSGGEILYQRSLDNGATWQALDYPGFSPSGTGVTAAAAASKPNGDLALFFTDTASLYLIRRVNGVWQTRTQWNKSTGNLYGAAVVYDGDWKLAVSGRDSSGNYKVWSLVYGDGGEVTAGTWTDLREIASAPPDGEYRFGSVYLDKLTGGLPSVSFYRCYFNEIFTGNEGYDRPFDTHTLPGSSFLKNRWREAEPCTAPGGEECAAGLAAAHTAEYAWLSAPAGVWRAGLGEQILDLSGDVIAASCDLGASSGELAVELRTSSYALPASSGELEALDTGCRVELAPGCGTEAGLEYSPGLSFILESHEYINSPGKASRLLYAVDGWKALERWTARFQFRWNGTGEETPVKEILAQILARAGIRLEVISQSTAAANFCPDFTVHPGDNGKAAVLKLLSFVPDVLFMEGDTAYLIHPLAGDAAVYSYFSPREKKDAAGGSARHVILESQVRSSAWKYNRVKIEGRGVTVDCRSLEESRRNGDILKITEDQNLDTAVKARERGEACLRRVEMEAGGGCIRVPVNCGQQLFDVIEITERGAGLAGARRRVMEIEMTYIPRRRIYEQKLVLGNV